MLDMGWIGLVMAIVAAYFVVKVAKFVFKLLWFAALLFGIYWFAAPLLGLSRPF